MLFNVLVGDRTGKSITYRVGLDVVKRTASSDNGARSLGKAALLVAIIAGRPGSGSALRRVCTSGCGHPSG